MAYQTLLGPQLPDALIHPPIVRPQPVRTRLHRCRPAPVPYHPTATPIVRPPSGCTTSHAARYLASGAHKPATRRDRAERRYWQQMATRALFSPPPPPRLVAPRDNGPSYPMSRPVTVASVRAFLAR